MLRKLLRQIQHQLAHWTHWNGVKILSFRIAPQVYAYGYSCVGCKKVYLDHLTFYSDSDQGDFTLYLDSHVPMEIWYREKPLSQEAIKELLSR